MMRISIFLLLLAVSSSFATADLISSFIVGGSQVGTDDPIYHSTVEIDAGSSFCSGTMISADLVLTAAHCLTYGPTHGSALPLDAVRVSFPGTMAPHGGIRFVRISGFEVHPLWHRSGLSRVRSRGSSRPDADWRCPEKDLGSGARSGFFSNRGGAGPIQGDGRLLWRFRWTGSPRIGSEILRLGSGQPGRRGLRASDVLYSHRPLRDMAQAKRVAKTSVNFWGNFAFALNARGIQCKGMPRFQRLVRHFGVSQVTIFRELARLRKEQGKE